MKNSKDYNKEYYLKNKEHRKNQIRQRNLIAIQRNRSNMITYLQGKCCIDCGHGDWRVLQFDHLDPLLKSTTVSNMTCSAYSWQTILDEIAKCELVCANCHIIRTGNSFGFYRFMPG